ncbi:hypothetical protein ACFPT7_14665 [Acidicapsa dinghuensis]|uniref:DUF4149 domain-containing protein n=1 Tax=Acidicapsa dinghuensis TaxID=2218256 RepID=A0ABW1EGZ7_9BACT|nr:hypothetical protein [Acidicapsa dinghuensis]
MEITSHGLWTMIHGMLFGALYLLACSGAIVEIRRYFQPSASKLASPISTNFLRVWLVVMSALAWLAVLTGAYIVYPWYRAVPPPGTSNLAAYPQRLLIASPSTSAWHSIGMEWKEHIAWIAAISITMAAAMVLRYGTSLRHHRELRTTLLSFVTVSFLAAAIAGFFGAMLNKVAPVQGGTTIHLVQEQ